MCLLSRYVFSGSAEAWQHTQQRDIYINIESCEDLQQWLTVTADSMMKTLVLQVIKCCLNWK